MNNEERHRDIKCGDKFFCFKNAYFDSSGSIIFKEGKIYESKINGCITDENMNQYHLFSKQYWSQYLIKLKFLSTYDYTLNENLASLYELHSHGYAHNRKTNQIIKIK